MSQEKAASDSLLGVTEQEMLKTAKDAARLFSSYNREQVQKIVAAVSAAAYAKAAHYAEWSVRETGYGVVEHKKVKNELAAVSVPEFYKDTDFTAIQVDTGKKVVKIPRPAGVVLGLAPCTNPIATIIFKSMISILSRNALIICPHPAAKGCCVDAADVIAEAAEQAGAPKGIIQVVREPNLPLVGALMKSDQINVILATGGPGVVRAAYSSGNPALGVGSGNVADYVDESAVIQKAAAEIVLSASFDNNLPCTCVSVVLAEREIADELAAELKNNGSHMVADPQEIEKLRAYLYPEGNYNPAAVGKSAQWIADEAGISFTGGAVVLCVEIERIDPNDVFAREKFFPVLGFLRVKGVDGALEAARAMIATGGAGHSVSVHSNKPAAVAAMSTLDVYRVAVNGPSVLVSSGVASGLAPTFTLGTGYFGRSSVGENVGPGHLVHWTSIAYNSDPSEVMGDIADALAFQARC